MSSFLHELRMFWDFLLELLKLRPESIHPDWSDSQLPDPKEIFNNEHTSYVVRAAKRYVIVFYADDKWWRHHFEEDPKYVGVYERQSAYYTIQGKNDQIKPFYDHYDEAYLDLWRLRFTIDRQTGYGICPVIEE